MMSKPRRTAGAGAVAGAGAGAGAGAAAAAMKDKRHSIMDTLSKLRAAASSGTGATLLVRVMEKLQTSAHQAANDDGASPGPGGGELASPSGDDDTSARSSSSRRSRGPVTDSSTRFQKLVFGLGHCISQMSEASHRSSSSSDPSSPGPEEAAVSNDDLERWSTLIYESMSAPSRTFHSVQHVFDISAGSDDPVVVGAAYFHDVIYYHVDGGLTAAQGEVLEGIIREEEGDGKNKKVYLQDIQEGDKAMRLVMAVFGFESGQELNPFLGLNEFLSAALACRCLQGKVGLAHIAQVAACIEMTIPFRKSKDGKNPAHLLHERLQAANDSFSLELTDDDLIRTTKRAVDIANRDVANFSSENPAHFLSNTWNLLPESNVTLRHTSAFRISDFTLALKKMEGFFSFLDPDVIYVSFDGSPPEEELAAITDRARYNLGVALKYMRCKLLGVSVLAALAELTGGDAPVAMFLGDLPEPGYVSPSIEDFIVAPPFGETEAAKRMWAVRQRKPEDDDENGEKGRENGDGGNSATTTATATAAVTIDEAVYNLLRSGREAESSFDLKHSPLAAYLYGLMGDAGLEVSLEHAGVFPMNDSAAGKLLDCVPREAVRKIAGACATIAVTRSGKLKDIAKRYGDDDGDEDEKGD